MGSLNLHYLGVADMSHFIERRELSPVEIVKAHLTRIEALEPKLNSFITLT